MIAEIKVAQLPRDKPLKVRFGPARETTCALLGCPLGEHDYAVSLPNSAGKACAQCAAERGFELDWSAV